MIDLKQDFFALFGLTPAFSIDMEKLEQAYIDIQARVHPDRFAHLSDTEKRLSMQWATHANEAFRTLKGPLTRGHYLLELRGVDPGFDTNTAMSPDFLMEQMEWREALDEAREARDLDALDDLARNLRHARRDAEALLARQLDTEHDTAAAAATLRRMMFIARLGEDIAAVHETLEN